MSSRRCRAQAAAAALQLGCGVAGMAVALRRRHAYDIPLGRGNPESVARDSVLIGTALSPPVTMLVAQVALIAPAARGSERATRGLQALGAAMVGGYLAERLVRRRLRPGSTDPVETPLAAAGLSLAAAMVALGPPRGR